MKTGKSMPNASPSKVFPCECDVYDITLGGQTLFVFVDESGKVVGFTDILDTRLFMEELLQKVIDGAMFQPLKMT